MPNQSHGLNSQDHLGYPEQTSNAIEALANILYLIGAKAEDPGAVRHLAGLAHPAIETLKQIVPSHGSADDTADKLDRGDTGWSK